jgi:fructosamine-3-kinase
MGLVDATGKPPIGQALRDRLGEPAVVRRIASSQRSRVWLVEFGGSPAIVKQAAGGVDAGERYDREITALTVASRVRPAVVPVLLGVDPDSRVMVLEYLAGAGPTPAGWHIDYATGLARLHAAGRGGGNAPGHVVPLNPEDVPGPPALPLYRGPGVADVRAFLGFAARVGVVAPRVVEDELVALVGRLAVAEGDALLHGDPCPDNAVPTADGMRFVDLEQAAWGSGVVELAYLNVGFPTCKCVAATPAGVLSDAVAAYRETWRSITGGDPGGDLVDAGAGWLLMGDALVHRARRADTDHLDRAARRDWRWGASTARERLVHRLGVVADATGTRADLANAARLFADLRARMLARWPGLAPLPITAGDPLLHVAAP